MKSFISRNIFDYLKQKNCNKRDFSCFKTRRSDNRFRFLTSFAKIPDSIKTIQENINIIINEWGKGENREELVAKAEQNNYKCIRIEREISDLIFVKDKSGNIFEIKEK